MAQIQSDTKTQATVALAATISIVTQNTTAGNLLVLVSNDDYGVVGQITGISDGTNTWHKANATSENSFCDTEIWYAYNIGGGAKPTLTIT